MADLINQNNLGANNTLNAGSAGSNSNNLRNGIFSYLAKNERVFDGTVNKQLDNLFVQDFNTKQILKDADMHAGHHFEMDM